MGWTGSALAEGERGDGRAGVPGQGCGDVVAGVVSQAGEQGSCIARQAILTAEWPDTVTGVTLKLWGGESDSGCCSASDVEDARRVAAQLGIPHYVFNFSDDFDASVVDPYAGAYAAGATPNPCVECNRTMKFGRALERRFGIEVFGPQGY